MSEYLANRIKQMFPDINLTDVKDNTIISLNCDIHGSYTKTVHQILYKTSKCPECSRLARNRKLSEIGKTKIGEKNNFNGNDLYHKNDFNKNNLTAKIPKPVPYTTNKGIVYTAGKLY